MKIIMVVDDSPSAKSQIVTYLERNGYRAMYTEDPADVPMLMLTERPNALIVDLDMPGVSGAELIQLVRSWSHCRLMPILALVQPDAPDEITCALLAGANDVLLKPVQENLLIAQVSSRFWHQSPSPMETNGTDVIPRLATANLIPHKPKKLPSSTTTIVAAAKVISAFVGAVSPWARMGKRRN